MMLSSFHSGRNYGMTQSSFGHTFSGMFSSPSVVTVDCFEFIFCGTVAASGV